MTQVWGREFSGEPQALYVHISWLREKLASVEGHTVRILTVHRVGYKLVAEERLMLRTLRGRLIASHMLLLLIVIPVVGLALVYVLESQVVLANLARQLTSQGVLIAEMLERRSAGLAGSGAGRRVRHAHRSALSGQVDAAGARRGGAGLQRPGGHRADRPAGDAARAGRGGRGTAHLAGALQPRRAGRGGGDHGAGP